MENEAEDITKRIEEIIKSNDNQKAEQLILDIFKMAADTLNRLTKENIELKFDSDHLKEGFKALDSKSKRHTQEANYYARQCDKLIEVFKNLKPRLYDVLRDGPEDTIKRNMGEALIDMAKWVNIDFKDWFEVQGEILDKELKKAEDFFNEVTSFEESIKPSQKEEHKCNACDESEVYAMVVHNIIDIIGHEGRIIDLPPAINSILLERDRERNLHMQWMAEADGMDWDRQWQHDRVNKLRAKIELVLTQFTLSSEVNSILSCVLKDTEQDHIPPVKQHKGLAAELEEVRLRNQLLEETVQILHISLSNIMKASCGPSTDKDPVKRWYDAIQKVREKVREAYEVIIKVTGEKMEKIDGAVLFYVLCMVGVIVSLMRLRELEKNYKIVEFKVER